jgi:hypothetical protein
MSNRLDNRLQTFSHPLPSQPTVLHSPAEGSATPRQPTVPPRLAPMNVRGGRRSGAADAANALHGPTLSHIRLGIPLPGMTRANEPVSVIAPSKTKGAGDIEGRQRKMTIYHLMPTTPDQETELDARFAGRPTPSKADSRRLSDTVYSLIPPGENEDDRRARSGALSFRNPKRDSCKPLLPHDYKQK